MTPFDRNIKEIIEFSWPMTAICIFLFSSIRIVDVIKNKKKFVLYKELFFLIFLVYVLSLFQVVTFEDPTLGLLQNNLTPLKEIMRYEFGSRLFFKNVLGNFLMFVPYGLFVSIIVKLDKWYQAVFLVAFASVTVEATQLLIGRVFDVDDIILNISGGTFGYFLYYLGMKIANRFPKLLKNGVILNLLTITILISLLYYIWKVVY